jgi:phage tail sheath protein FI
MPEYLSPGVYVEEFESGPRPMSGVSTSIPGFLGLTERGPTKGLPQLVTGMADFNRKYGSYLPRKQKDDIDYRFLPYAVEQFFVNGVSSCYFMRIGVNGALSSKIILFD